MHTGSEQSALNCAKANQAVIATTVDDPDVNFVDLSGTPSLIGRQKLTLALDKSTINADGIDEAQLTGLPQPITLLINGAEVEVTDGSLEFSTEEVGRHEVCVCEASYLDESFEIYAV